MTTISKNLIVAINLISKFEIHIVHYNKRGCKLVWLDHEQVRYVNGKAWWRGRLVP